MGNGAFSKATDNSQRDLAGSSETGNDNCVRSPVKAKCQTVAESPSLNGSPKADAGAKHAGISQSHLGVCADEHHGNPEAAVSPAVAHNDARKGRKTLFRNGTLKANAGVNHAGLIKAGVVAPFLAVARTLAWTPAESTSLNRSPKADAGVKPARLSQSHLEVSADGHHGNPEAAVSAAVAHNNAKKGCKTLFRNGTLKANAGVNHAGLIKA